MMQNINQDKTYKGYGQTCAAQIIGRHRNDPEHHALHGLRKEGIERPLDYTEQADSGQEDTGHGFRLAAAQGFEEITIR